MQERTIGPLLRQLRERTGRSQQEHAKELNDRTGRHTDRHQVSDWERGVIPGPYWREHIAAVLGVPDGLLARAAAETRRQRRMSELSATADEEGTEDPMERRIFLGAAAVAAGSAVEPWGRLAYALTGGSVDAKTVRTLTRHTATLYADEEHVPAPLLSARLTAHLDTITTLIPHAGKFRGELVITAGETAALAGWAAWDRGDYQDSAAYYRTVREASRQAGHPPLEALALVYASYGVGDPQRAVKILAEAQQCVKGPGYATAHAWTAAREAEEQAKAGQETGAVRAMDRARIVYEYANPQAEQAWVGFLRPARLDSMAVSTFTRLGLPEAADQADESVRSLDPDSPKINIAVLCDAAMAHLSTGEAERGVFLARQALDTAVAHQYTGMTMVDVRMRSLAQALPDSTTARSLAEDIHAAIG